MKHLSAILVALLPILPLAACDEAAEIAVLPPPVELTREAIGYYCSMIVVDHPGPKAQVHLAGREAPHFFTSVRDLVAFSMLPDEPRNIAAMYVTDAGRADWDRPEPGTWIDAREALYVIGSDRRGGMGAPETVPFADRLAAEAFARRHGGHVVAFAEIPHGYVLGDATPSEEPAHVHAGHTSAGPQTERTQ